MYICTYVASDAKQCGVKRNDVDIAEGKLLVVSWCCKHQLRVYGSINKHIGFLSTVKSLIVFNSL